jgi:hypothetical protein
MPGGSRHDTFSRFSRSCQRGVSQPEQRPDKATEALSCTCVVMPTWTAGGPAVDEDRRMPDTATVRPKPNLSMLLTRGVESSDTSMRCPDSKTLVCPQRPEQPLRGSLAGVGGRPSLPPSVTRRERQRPFRAPRSGTEGARAGTKNPASRSGWTARTLADGVPAVAARTARLAAKRLRPRLHPDDARA